MRKETKNVFENSNDDGTEIVIESIPVNDIIKSKLDLEESVTKVKSYLAPPENKDKKDPRITFVSSFLPEKNGKIDRFYDTPIIKMHGSIPSPHLFQASEDFSEQAEEFRDGILDGYEKLVYKQRVLAWLKEFGANILTAFAAKLKGGIAVNVIQNCKNSLKLYIENEHTVTNLCFFASLTH